MLNCRKANIQFFRELVNKTYWITDLEDKGEEQSSWIFKEAFLSAQELSISRCRKPGKEARDSIAEPGLSSKTGEKEGHEQAVEVGTGTLAKVQECC